MLVRWHDFQPQDPSVPVGRLMPVGHKQFDVVDVVDSEFIVRS